MSDSSSLSSAVSVKTYEHEWIEAFKGDVPEGAVKGGYYTEENEKTQLYVARGFFKDKLLSGSLNPKDGCCYVTWKGSVGKLTAYEVLCNADTRWVPDSSYADGPDDLLGFSSDIKKEDDGDLLVFPARVKYKKSIIIGYYSNERTSMNIAYQGKEKEFDKYETMQFVS